MYNMFSIKEISIHAVVKGYHAYRIKPDVGDVLRCQREPGNPRDPRAVRVVDGTGRTVGHVPARPVPLNKALFEILDNWPGFPVEWYCKY